MSRWPGLSDRLSTLTAPDRISLDCSHHRLHNAIPRHHLHNNHAQQDRPRQNPEAIRCPRSCRAAVLAQRIRSGFCACWSLRSILLHRHLHSSKQDRRTKSCILPGADHECWIDFWAYSAQLCSRQNWNFQHAYALYSDRWSAVSLLDWNPQCSRTHRVRCAIWLLFGDVSFSSPACCRCVDQRYENARDTHWNMLCYCLLWSTGRNPNLWCYTESYGAICRSADIRRLLHSRCRRIRGLCSCCGSWMGLHQDMSLLQPYHLLLSLKGITW